MLDDLIYYGMHKVMGQDLSAPFVTTIAYTVIGTTIVGTIIYLILDSFFSGKKLLRKRDIFAPRRQTRRRNPIRLGRRP